MSEPAPPSVGWRGCLRPVREEARESATHLCHDTKCATVACVLAQT